MAIRLSAMKFISIVIIASFLGGTIAFVLLQHYKHTKEIRIVESMREIKFTSLPKIKQDGLQDFVLASKIATPSVVHVKSIKRYSYKERLGVKNLVGENSGSGVIISSDGYIVSNYHVVKDAKKIMITLWNKMTFKGQLVGYDEKTDLALIKIPEYNLAFMEFSNSDEAEVGNWVLSVGNPFNLVSTVTAGIISATGRDLNLSGSKNALESFIQTDAVVNPGNSGGALVSLDGKLIGIISAMVQYQGKYAGYSFAVPSNVVWKVVKDLKKYQSVQRAFMGISVLDITPELAIDEELMSLNGVWVDDVDPRFSAAIAGVEAGDVIFKINDHTINRLTDFEEKMAQYSPGETILIGFRRENESKYVVVILKNINNEISIVRDTKKQFLSQLGASLEDVPLEELKKLNLTNGARIYELKKGALNMYTTIKEGFIISAINRKQIENAKQAYTMFEQLKPGETVLIEGYYPEGAKRVYFSFAFPQR